MAKFRLTNKDSEVTFKGRLGHDAKYNAEHDVTNLDIAASRSWQSDKPEAVNGWMTKTAWYEIAVWKNGAQELANLKAGDTVEVVLSMADRELDVFQRADGTYGASAKYPRARVRLICPRDGYGGSESYEADVAEAEPEGMMVL